MKITRKNVEDVALLARLDIHEDQIEVFTEQLDAILEYADLLNKVDTEGIQPTAHVLPLKNVMRPDVVRESLPQELALSNAPEQENGYFKVPKVVEG